jgi:hypothetical protein
MQLRCAGWRKLIDGLILIIATHDLRLCRPRRSLQNYTAG